MVIRKICGKIEKTDVYLPEGSNWFDFWTGAKLAGGQTIQREVPIDIMPVYIRAGFYNSLGGLRCSMPQKKVGMTWRFVFIRVLMQLLFFMRMRTIITIMKREFILLSLSVGMIVTVLCTSATVKEDIPECWKRGSSK